MAVAAAVLPFGPPIMLAPMEGVTSAPVRAVFARRGGFGILCTEFVRVGRAPPTTKQLRREVVKADGLPLSVQVMGNDPGPLAEAAACVAGAGADVVDVNLGCPTRRAMSKGVGAALLADPERLTAVARALRAAIPGVFSAKLRAGVSHTEDALRNARILVEAGVDFLIVHPRRRVDHYEGVADHSIVRAIAREVPVPVIANGDLWYAEAAARVLEQTGAAGVMFGRSALRNPWVAAQLAARLAGTEPPTPSGADLVAHVKQLLPALAPEGEAPIGPLKEHLGWLLRAVPEVSELRRGVLRSQSVEELLERLQPLVALEPAQLDLDAHGSHQLERCPSL